jgi:hypothetical protein
MMHFPGHMYCLDVPCSSAMVQIHYLHNSGEGQTAKSVFFSFANKS